MPVTFKNRVTFPEMLTSIFFQQFNLPLNIFWIGITLFLVKVSGILEYLRTGRVLWFLGAFGNLVLTQEFFVSVSMIALFGLMFLLRFSRPPFRDEEFTFDEEIVSFKNEATEARIPLKGITGYVETKRYFTFFRSDMNTTTFAKSSLTTEELLEVKTILRGKHSPVIEWIGRVFLPANALLLLVTVWALLAPSYTVRTAAENVQAFWREDTLLVSIPVYKHGSRESLLQNMHPILFALLNRKPPRDAFATDITDHVFIVRDGRLKRLALKAGEDEALGLVQPVGNDLFLIRYVARQQEFSRFDGENFVPVDPQEREEILVRMKECRRERCGWERFGLWDEDKDDEEENPNADQSYRATLRLRSSEYILGMEVTWRDRKEYAQDRDFTLKGLRSGGAVEELLSVEGKPRRMGGEEYRTLFSKGLFPPGNGGEANVDEPEVPLESAPSPALGATPEPTAEVLTPAGMEPTETVVDEAGETPTESASAPAGTPVDTATVPVLRVEEAATEPVSMPTMASESQPAVLKVEEESTPAPTPEVTP